MESFRLFNIKSFEDTGEIDIKPITVFVGKNSSGKSSLVRFPVVLAQTFMEDTISPIIFNGKQVDYGNFEDVVHGHEGKEVGFKMNLPNTIFGRGLMIPGNGTSVKSFVFNTLEPKLSASVEVIVQKTNGKIDLQSQILYINGQKIWSSERNKNNHDFKLFYIIKNAASNKRFSPLQQPLSLNLSILEINRFILYSSWNFRSKKSLENSLNFLQEKFPQLSQSELISLLEMPTSNDKNIDLKEEAQKAYDFINSLYLTFLIINEIMRVINSYFNRSHIQLHYIGPFRTNPERTYRASESLKDSVGIYGENVSMLLYQAKRDQHPVFEEVNQWLKEALGYSIKIEDIPDSNLFRIKVATDENPRGDNLIDVGYGISQILPIVTQLYYKSQKSGYRRYRASYEDIYIVEQPEIHLHPNAQAELGNLFVEKISNKKTKILVETHSEHLIRRLQSLVADPDNDFNVDDVAIYYVDMPQPGKSTVKKMEMNEMGQFKEAWPSGFFDKAYQLSKELVKNAAKRAAKV